MDVVRVAKHVLILWLVAMATVWVAFIAALIGLWVDGLW